MQTRASAESRFEMAKSIKAFFEDDIKRSILFLVLGGLALLSSLLPVDYPINPAWLAILLCGVPIIK